MSESPIRAKPPIRLGIDLGGTRTEIVALDAAGADVWRKRVPTPRGGSSGVRGAAWLW